MLVAADAGGRVVLSVASVAFSFPGAGGVVLVSFFQALEPAFFVEVGSAAAGVSFGAIESGNKVMGEHHAVVGCLGHFFRMSWTGLEKKEAERSRISLERSLPDLALRRLHSVWSRLKASELIQMWIGWEAPFLEPLDKICFWEKKASQAGEPVDWL